MRKRKTAVYIAISIILLAALSGSNSGRPRVPQIDEVASAQYSLNSTHDNPDPYDMSNSQDRQTIGQILAWLRSAKPVKGATTHTAFSMGPADLLIYLKNGSVVSIDPAIDSTSKKLSNGSIEISSVRKQGQVVFRQAKQAVRLEAPQLSDWLVNGWNAGNHKIPDETKYLQRIHMLNASEGWGTAIGHVFHTEDGGNSWSKVATPDFQTDSSEWAASYQNTKIARIAEPRKKEIRVYRTSDEGEHWDTAVVKTDFKSTNNSLPHIFSFGFLENGFGWMMAGFDANQDLQYYELYVTSDGGANWQRISAYGPDISDTGGLPPAGFGPSVAYITHQRGWVAGYTRGSGVWLYQTQDGGTRWQRQDLDIPKDFIVGSESMITVSLKFFSSTDGILSVVNHDKGQPTLFYATHDGGSTWNLESYSKPDGNQQVVWDFPDPEHGFMVSNENEIFTTADGAKTWDKINPTGDVFQFINQLDFISDDVGWIPKGRYLLKTVNGGRTWSQVKYSVSQ